MVMRTASLWEKEKTTQSLLYLTQFIASKPSKSHAGVYSSSCNTNERHIYLLKIICGKSFRLLFPILLDYSTRLVCTVCVYIGRCICCFFVCVPHFTQVSSIKKCFHVYHFSCIQFVLLLFRRSTFRFSIIYILFKIC